MASLLCDLLMHSILLVSLLWMIYTYDRFGHNGGNAALRNGGRREVQTNSVTIDGEPVTFVSFTEQEWNLAAENNCDTVKALERDAACDLSLLGQDVCFDKINPEDIVGDGVGDRNWGQ